VSKMPTKRRRVSNSIYRAVRVPRRRPAMSRRRSSKYRPRTRIAKTIRSVVNKMSETKETLLEVAKNLQVTHNTVHNLSSNALYTQIGMASQDTDGPDSAGSRIGQKIYAKGLKCALMIENQQYRPQVTYWLYLLKAKEGNPAVAINAKNDIFEGRSTTIPMDYIDTQKVNIMYCKKIIVKMPNSGTTLIGDATVTGAYYEESGGASYAMVTNPQRILKFYIPINRIIQYPDATSSADRTVPLNANLYQWVIIPYNNYSSTPGSTVYPVGHVSLTTKFVYKDF